MADTKQGVLMARERNMRKDWRQLRTAGGPRPQRSRKDQGVGDFPGVLVRATRCDRGPVAVRYFAPASSQATAGSWRESLQASFCAHWDHESCECCWSPISITSVF